MSTVRRLVVGVVMLLVRQSDLGRAVAAGDQGDERRFSLGDGEIVFRRIAPRADDIDYPEFYMQETEVTNEQFRLYLADTGRTKDDREVWNVVRAQQEQSIQYGADGYSITVTVSTGGVQHAIDDPDTIWRDNKYPEGMASFPVAVVSLDDAKEFCNWLSEKHSEAGSFRLPTWNEWVIAAYGNERAYPWGQEWNPSCVHMSQGRIRVRRPEDVKSRARGRTPQGLYGMFGNVAEFIHDGDPTNRDYFRLGSRWMGGGFATGSGGNQQDGKVTPRKDYWGYSHDASIRRSDTGFRVLLDPSKDTTLVDRPRVFRPVIQDWMIKNDD